jgi:methionyl-tRNA formyltransferase
MKVVFLGTPEFGKIVLEKLAKSHHEVVAVICGVDKPQGRGNKLTPPPTKVFALQNNIPVYQFSRIRKQGVETLKSLNADVFVTAAFGQILSQEILDIAPFGVVNVHGSLLPKYRGAAPVQYALLNGETVTGVTIMKTFVGIDDGDMILSQTVDIDSNDNTDTLMQKLAHVGGDLLVKALDQMQNGTAVFTPQDHSQATHTKMLPTDRQKLDFSLSAHALHNFVRAYTPNPSCYFEYNGQTFKVVQTAVGNMQNQNCLPGQVVVASGKQGLFVACGEGVIEIVLLQPAGGKVMSAKSYLNGKQIAVGTILN